jgi:ABC-2 type transport system permease protein
MTHLIKLEILRIARNRKFLFFNLLYPVLLYVVISRSVGGGKIGSTGLDINLYFMISMAGFGAMGAALMTTAQRIALEREKGWVRQLRLTALNQNGYVIAKILAAAATTAPSIIIVLLVGALANGVSLEPWQWISVFFAMWIGSFVFAAMGVALGYAASPDAIQPIVMICYMGMSLLGGLWMPLEGFPSWLRSIGEVLPTYRFAGLGKAIGAGGAPHQTDVLILVAYLAVFVAAAGWLYRRDKDRT